MITPISIEEIKAAKAKAIPEEILAIFNELIIKHWSGRQARILQDEIIDLILDRTKIQRNEIFSNNYLDIEEAYRSVGWKVSYDKPGYNENYIAFFLFEDIR